MLSPRLSEKVVQSNIIQLLHTVNAVVYTLGVRRPRGDYQGTCMSPGLPDLYVLLPARGNVRAHAVWIEVKVRGARLRPQQVEFATLCGGAGIPHLVGDVDVVLRYLQEHGYVR